MLRKIVILMLSGISMLAISAAYATTPKSIVVFGESFTDSGNLYYLFGEPADNTWFTNGRIGNGQNWADYLADHYVHVGKMEASSYGGTNYAIGGADSSFDWGVWGLGSTGMQIAQYLDDIDGAIHGRGNVLIAYFIGGNDILTAQELSVTMDNISTQLNMLIEAGALHFLMPNMFPLGFTPDGILGGGFNAASIPPAELNSIAAAYNAALMDLLQEIKCGNPSVHFYPVDSHQLMLDVLADPLSYGFANTSDPVTWVAGDPETSLFWDGVHTTSRFQSMMADAAAAAIDHHEGGVKCDME